MAKLRAITGGRQRKTFAPHLWGCVCTQQGSDGRYAKERLSARRVRAAGVPLHLIEGTREQIRAQLIASIDASSTLQR